MTTTTTDLSLVFSADFLTMVSDTIKTKCADNVAMTKSDVCRELGLDDTFAPLISMVIEAGGVEGYGIKQGKGVCKLGVAHVKRASISSSEPKEVTVPEEFQARVLEALDRLVPADQTRGVPKKVISEDLGLTGVKQQLLLSAAISLLPDFVARVGANGGIFRVTALESLKQAKAAVTKPSPAVKNSAIKAAIESFLKSNGAASAAASVSENVIEAEPVGQDTENFPTEEELFAVADDDSDDIDC